MKKININNERNIVDDIDVLKEREPFGKLTDKEFMRIVLLVGAYLVISAIGIGFNFPLFAALIPFVGITGANIFIIKEFVKLRKKRKAEKNIEQVVKVLGVNDIKTNSNRLANSTVEHKDNLEKYSNCYLFLNKEDKLSGLYEEIDTVNKVANYYALNNSEVSEIAMKNVKNKVLTKSNTMIWR